MTEISPPLTLLGNIIISTIFSVQFCYSDNDTLQWHFDFTTVLQLAFGLDWAWCIRQHTCWHGFTYDIDADKWHSKLVMVKSFTKSENHQYAWLYIIIMVQNQQKINQAINQLVLWGYVPVYHYIISIWQYNFQPTWTSFSGAHFPWQQIGGRIFSVQLFFWVKHLEKLYFFFKTTLRLLDSALNRV